MAHPDYRCQPWGLERRRRASEAAKARIAAAKAFTAVKTRPSTADQELRERIVSRWLRGGITVQEIANINGITKGQASGVLFRAGVCRHKVKPPKGCAQVPLAECRKMVAATLLDGREDDRDPSFRAGVIMLASLFGEIWPPSLARYTGYPRAECERAYRTMVTHRLWWNGKQNGDRWLEGGDKPGLQMGELRFILEAGLITGTLTWNRHEDTWSAV